ncbi:hypothetical protein NMY22_g5752 [Coprinellus aureogranulatus]|nr:hypothetical protein NMY22_g5752 [Coprinellus aureogranulatus]
MDYVESLAAKPLGDMKVPPADSETHKEGALGTMVPVPRTGGHRELLRDVNPSGSSAVSSSASPSAQASDVNAVPTTVTTSTASKQATLQPRPLSRRRTASAPPTNSNDEEMYVHVHVYRDGRKTKIFFSLLVFPQDAPGKGKVTITKADAARLKPGGFLNDTLIEFGLKLWLTSLEEANPELAKQIHVFSSFFYKKLNKRNIEEGFNGVRKWTSKFDLFDRKYIIVPINENMHWYLAVIYQPQHVLHPPPPESISPAAGDRPAIINSGEGWVNEPEPSTTASASSRSRRQNEKPEKTIGRARRPEPKAKTTFCPNRTYILTMDSLGSKHHRVCTQLAKYLELEAKDKKNARLTANIQLKQVNVPTQPNFCDCGLYLLHLAETFISDAERLLRKDFETTSRTPHSEKQELWQDSRVPVLREKLLKRIESLSREWKESSSSSSKVKEDAVAGTEGDASDSDVDIVAIGPVKTAARLH